MPEGPSMVILKELVTGFKGKKITAVSGTTTVEVSDLVGQKVTDFKTWGKHFLICFKKTTIRIHFLLFGSYRINEKRVGKLKLHLQFGKNELNFYACAIKRLAENPDEVYDWTADIMNKNWDPKAARKKLKSTKEVLVCDALLDQDIFSGVGNIIKNEVLFRIRVHPESNVSELPTARMTAMLKEARVYSFEFLKWKKEGTLKKNWEAYAKKKCPRCDIPLVKKITGKRKRRSFFCANCQVKY